MKERDVLEAIIEIGMKRGKVTYEEINDALPSEFFSLDELASIVGLLVDMGVKVIEYNSCHSDRRMKLAAAG